MIHDKISIEELSQKSEYGSKLIESISNDLKQVLPNVKSFSPINLKYMRQFYVLFNSEQKSPQVGGELDYVSILPQSGANSNDLLAFMVPWGI